MSSKLEIWKIGRVVYISPNGRRLEIKYPTPGHNSLDKLPSVFRSVRDICIIAYESDLDLNSNEFLRALNEGIVK